MGISTTTKADPIAPEPRPFRELRSEGLLWLVNTAVFHPRGYAIALVWAEGSDPDVDEPMGWELQGDGRERWAFDQAVAEELDMLFERVKELMP